MALTILRTLLEDDLSRPYNWIEMMIFAGVAIAL
jgi:hypothetical protein